MQFTLSAILLLFAFTQSYVWTRKKKDKEAGPSYRRPPRSSKRKVASDAHIIPTHTTTVQFNTMLEVFSNGDWTHGTMVELTHEECAQNVDLGQIVCPKVDADPTCTLFSALGTRVVSCQDLRVENSVFVVPKDRLFMLPTKGVGHVSIVEHIPMPTEEAILMETLSVEPRIFRLTNFLSTEEVDALIAEALPLLQDASLPLPATGSDAAGSARGGAGDGVVGTEVDGSSSTSSSAFSSSSGDGGDYSYNFYGGAGLHRAVDMAQGLDSPTAQALKLRMFDLLGIYPFQDSFAEGIQVLRYNESGAYMPHMDWIDPLYPTQHMHHPSKNPQQRQKQGQGQSNTSANLGTSATDRNSAVDDHDYDSSILGTNRFATLVLYLTDVEEGGETLFSALPPSSPSSSVAGGGGGGEESMAQEVKKENGKEVVLEEEEEDLLLAQEMRRAALSGEAEGVTEEDIQAVLWAKKKERLADAYLAAQNATHTIKKGTWQHDLLGECRTHLVTKAVRAEALLFYSQYPDGMPNLLTRHGGCPVIRGQKWVANLWVWNGPRAGSWSRNSVTGKIEKPLPTGVSAAFECVDINDAQLYWEEQLWEALTPGRTVKVNTYHGHRWHVRVDDQVVVSWTIDASKPNQRFIVSAAAVAATTVASTATTETDTNTASEL